LLSPTQIVAVSDRTARGRAPLSPDASYDTWLRQHTISQAELRDASNLLQSLAWQPLISVIVPVFNSQLDYLKKAVDSVQAQIYQNWEICIADDCSTDTAVGSFLRAYSAQSDRVKLTRLVNRGHVAAATNAAIQMAEGEFLAFLDHDDEIIPTALLEMVELLQKYPETDIVYSDHDIINREGLLQSPNFKPDWSPELLLSYMYFGHLKLYRTELVKRLGGLRQGFEGSADYDLALRLVELTNSVRHLPRVLYHWRAAATSMASSSDTKAYSFESGRRAVQEALNRRGIAAKAIHPDFAQASKVGIYKLAFDGSASDPVTIVIPTRNKCDLLKACIESIERVTDYRSYEIVIIDNGSDDHATLNYLASTRHRVVHFATPDGFNFAAIVNFAVSQISSEYLLLLNNDTVVISADWLSEMMGYIKFPGVGAVGAKLLYCDQRVQHAGVILGVQGLTGHACQPLHNDQAPLEYALVARNYLAVTAACMLTRKSIFKEMGGLNQNDLKIGWNDVDYCLRLIERGYRIVMNPHALLYHYESQSRGDDKNDHEIAYMKNKWSKYIRHDPYFNPNFSRANSEFRIQTDP